MSTPKFLSAVTLCVFSLVTGLARAADKPALTLDEFFNAVVLRSVRISPDGAAVVIATERADWDKNMYRKDMWLYRGDGHAPGTLLQLTQSGRDSAPQWSPDGKWIAFLSERNQAPLAGDAKPGASEKDNHQLYLIRPSGGEAFPVTTGQESVHAFSWSPDSRTIYWATRVPRTKDLKDSEEKEWKDTLRYRASERGDELFAIDVAGAEARHFGNPARPPATDAEKQDDTTPASRALASTPWRVQEIAISPDGRRLAFATTSVSERQEKFEEFEIYLVELAGASPARPPRQVTRNTALEQDLRWAPDGRHLFFTFENGDAEGNYRDFQMRLYSVDVDSGLLQRWAATFPGAVVKYAVTPQGGLLVSARLGTEVQLYTQASAASPFTKLPGWAGTYGAVSVAALSSRVAFIYSSFDRPAEVYLADSAGATQNAQPVTSFNQVFTERNLPRARPYRWKADDGTAVEGMLVYPPGKFAAKGLPLFTLIHGGPNDADGNHFEADWYQWDRLAANQGWLVFEPNYRGSTGYGDKFLMQIVPQIVSRPGNDVLAGIDALVKDGIADPNRLAVGGYSYGGYMTNWLITQTTRFKAAVTGAGAIEHVANWGNDDTTLDDAYFLGGRPWEAARRYQEEAAIFQTDKIRTPTHIVAGADDIRVAVLEDYLLDHALHSMGVPSDLLIFPGEGHSLDKNPWHGKIKVREELKWLQKYGFGEPAR